MTRVSGLRVACPGIVEPMTAFTATRAPLGSARGTVVFLSGDYGQQWWASETESIASSVGSRHGFVTVQVRWQTGWPIAGG